MTLGMLIVFAFVLGVLAIAARPVRRGPRSSESRGALLLPSGAKTATAGPLRVPAVLAHSSALTEEGDRC